MIVAGSRSPSHVLDLDELELEPSAPEPRARVEAHARRCSACAERRAAHVALIEQFHVSVLPRTVEAVTARRARSAAAPLGGVARVAGGGGGAAAGHRPAARGRPSRTWAANRRWASRAARSSRCSRAANGAGGRRSTDRRWCVSSDGMRLAPGDALRFVLFPSGMPYVLIASVDGAGQVNIYYPFHGEASALASGQGAISVPGQHRPRRGARARAAVRDLQRARVAGQPRCARRWRRRRRRARRRSAAPGRRRSRATVQASLLFEKEGAR